MARVVIVIVLLVLGIGASLMLRDDDVAPIPRTGPAAAASAVAAPPDVTTSPAAESAPAERVAAATAAAPTRELPADVVGFDVLVVDAVTEQPVAGAEACWLVGNEWEHLPRMSFVEQLELARDPERMARDFGMHGRSDANGLLRVQCGKQSAMVFAREGGRYAAGWFASGGDVPPGGRRLALRRDLTLHVRVLDHAGRAAVKVPVDLRVVQPDGGDPDRLIGNEQWTDGEGVAAFRHVQEHQRFDSGAAQGQAVAQWTLRVPIPSLAVEPVRVDAQNPPAEPVEIRLPPTGKLAVRVLFDGKPVRGVEALECRDAAVPETSERLRLLQGIGADGFARFPHVALGKTFLITQSQGGLDWDLAAPGPTLPDQLAEHTLDLDSGLTLVIGRVLAADGTPERERRFALEYDSDAGGGSGMPVHTDADGRFVTVLSRASAKRQKTAMRRFVVVDYRALAVPLRAVAAARTLEPGRNDLGDLTLRQDPLVCSGRLTIDDGELPQVGLIIERYETPARGEPRWVSEQTQQHVQPDGRFEVRRELPPGRYRMQPGPGPYRPIAPLEFALGAKDVLVALQRGAELRAICLLPAGIENHMLRLRLAPKQPLSRAPGLPETTRRDDPLRGQGYGEDGVFRWSGLEASEYSLHVELPGILEPILTIDEVVLPLPATDQRFAAIDLRERIALLQLALQWPGGVADPASKNLMVFPQPQPVSRPWDGCGMRGGDARLAVPSAGCDLLVCCYGFRPQQVRGVPPRVEVALQAWPAVELTLAGGGKLPTDGTLLVSLEPPEHPLAAQQYETDWSSGSFDQWAAPRYRHEPFVDGKLTLQLGEGVHRLRLRARLGNFTQELRVFSPGELVVGPPVTVQLQDSEVAAAFAQLRERAAAPKK